MNKIIKSKYRNAAVIVCLIKPSKLRSNGIIIERNFAPLLHYMFQENQVTDLPQFFAHSY